MTCQLEPEAYPCPVHPHIDLTPQVAREACADPTVVISEELPGPSFDIPGQTGRQSPRPFMVGITCSGRTADGQGKAEPHRVYLFGEVR